MYYSNQSENLIKKNANQEISTLIDSSLSADRVFDGNYWDDFCLPVFLRKNIKNVLMLGLGYGAGVRSMYAAKPDLKIVGVDIDSESNKVCHELYNNMLGLNLEIVTDCADNFLKNSKTKFDLIWIDLYDKVGALSITYDDNFWKTIESCLTPQGMVAINAFGIANHLEKYVEASPLKFYLHQGAKFFNFYKIFPHRRNTTLVFSSQEFESYFDNHDKLSLLKNEDLMTLKNQYRRSQSIDYKVSIPSQKTYLKAEYSFEYLNQQQRRAWQNFLSEMNSIISNDFKFLTAPSLAEYIKNKKECENLIKILCEKKSDCVMFIPTYLGAEVHNDDKDYLWVVDLLLSLKDKIQESQYHLWQHIFAPQMVSILNTEKLVKIIESTNLFSQIESQGI